MNEIGITRVTNLTGLDRVGVPVFCAVRPGSHSNSVSFGKSIDPWASLVGAVMEAVEQYYAELVYLKNKTESLKHWQISAMNLLTDTVINVQVESVHAVFDRAVVDELPEDTSLSTNGLASGNCYEEAVNHALWEIVERDATKCWIWCGEAYRRSSRIRLNSIDSIDIQVLIETLERNKITIFLFDLSCDSNIPTVLAVLLDESAPENSMLRVLTASGSHATAEVAVLRAITEAIQRRITLIAGARDDVEWILYHQSQDRHKLEAFVRSSIPMRSLDQLPGFFRNSVSKDLYETLGRIRKLQESCDLNPAVLVSTLTTHGLPFCVVKAVIPGLEGPIETDGSVSNKVLAFRIEKLVKQRAVL